MRRPRGSLVLARADGAAADGAAVGPWPRDVATGDGGTGVCAAGARPAAAAAAAAAADACGLIIRMVGKERRGMKVGLSLRRIRPALAISHQHATGGQGPLDGPLSVTPAVWGGGDARRCSCRRRFEKTASTWPWASAAGAKSGRRR
ncbi:hypothetical protein CAUPRSCDRAFT_10902 [Caulochytrium protostelioides]|uniref:Uncharacterized protein n=1 Tax=Caulochytrium protostelioides TaxID=1555241 RepID=A0A4P9WVT9_9FUNG|nr:hypothetical protein CAUPRSCDRAFT_10902 [Caulochytrium protostelioides]